MAFNGDIAEAARQQVYQSVFFSLSKGKKGKKERKKERGGRKDEDGKEKEPRLTVVVLSDWEFKSFVLRWDE